MSLLSSDVRAAAPPRRDVERIVLQRTMPAVSVRSRRLNRMIDATLASLMLAASIPLMAAVALAVRLSGSGQVIFRHQRVGEGGALFDVLKFRTMAEGTHAEVQTDPELRALYELNGFKLPGDDPRITPVGRWLRRTSLDELPQLINILRGEMSLVGVRPLLENELELRSDYDRGLYELHRPGLTGLWQVEGRSTVNDDERVELDRRHLEQWSVRLNARILLRTPKAVLVGAGAH